MHSRGFTLIEVLVAMVVVAVAFVGIMKANNDNVASLTYVEEKTIAYWVAEDVITQVQVGLLQIVNTQQKRNGKTEMLGSAWHWEVSMHSTRNPQLQMITVVVTEGLSNQTLAQLDGYLIVEERADATV